MNEWNSMAIKKLLTGHDLRRVVGCKWYEPSWEETNKNPMRSIGQSKTFEWGLAVGPAQTLHETGTGLRRGERLGGKVAIAGTTICKGVYAKIELLWNSGGGKKGGVLIKNLVKKAHPIGVPTHKGSGGHLNTLRTKPRTTRRRTCVRPRRREFNQVALGNYSGRYTFPCFENVRDAGAAAWERGGGKNAFKNVMKKIKLKRKCRGRVLKTSKVFFLPEKI